MASAPYRVVRGHFALTYTGTRRQGSRPDGDSCWFRPDRKTDLKGLNRKVEFNKGGYCQLRFEGIDALEVHFQAFTKGAHERHQNQELAYAARDFLLKKLGFRSVQYGESGQVVQGSDPATVPGYILTNSVEAHHRPVAFVFTDTAPKKASVALDVKMLNRSLNAKVIRAGHAYPTFYVGLPVALRNRLIDSGASARKGPKPKGLWSSDVTQKATSVPNAGALEKVAMWPKLFRRLVSYFEAGNSGLGGFDAWLRNDPKEERDDDLWIASEARPAKLHEVVDISGNTIRMTHSPADLIIVPR